MKATKKSAAIIERTEARVAHNYKPLPVVLAKGQGVWVWDADGNRYMDMLSCYSALNAGHAHPELLKALKEQAHLLANCSRAYYSDQLHKMAELLCGIVGMESMLPMNSGAEAVETALKIARKWGYQKKDTKIESGKAEIVVCKNNFHGRTISIISFSSEDAYKADFGPLTPGFIEVPYGDLDALQHAITKYTAAFLVEPIQGEAGIIIPPRGFLRKARKLCTDAGILFIADEIQTGLGRTGDVLACEYDHIKPDIYVLGKALGGGFMPVSAVVCDWSIMDVMKPGEHGSTFGGGPLACAVASAYLDLMMREQFAERAKELGAYFMNELRTMKSPLVKEVRGRGLLVGVELMKDTGGARKYCEELMKLGILSKETHDYTVRFAPPLIITKNELDWALERIRKVFLL